MVVYLKGKEIGRGVTALGEFPESNAGIHDGLFVVEVDNPYGLSLVAINANENAGPNFSLASRRGFLGFETYRILYHFFDSVEEGGLITISVKAKNIEYAVKVFNGELASLPSEIQSPGSTALKNGKILAVLPEGENQGEFGGNARIQGVSYNTRTDTVEVNKITVPINNCGGSAPISQKYTQSQTFVQQYTVEAGVKIGVDIPVASWLRLLPELQAKYGFEQGQISTQTAEYNMAAEPRTNQVYVVTWKEVWESGTAEVTAGADMVLVPFKVKTNLIYQVDSQALQCTQ